MTATQESATASLVLYRDSGFVDAYRKYAILIDGRQIGSVKNGETKTISLEPGAHTLRLKIDWCSSNTISFDLTSNETARFRCGSNFLGPLCVFFAPSKYLYLRKSI
ncbi:MAG: hypothetical protein NTX87_07520 [Planctomycetota bacterium]|nr:hypothetical protein [Planctomycetota bacterium]